MIAVRMSSNEFIKILKDQKRTMILKLLHENGRMTYTEILREMNISTGLLNYHLRMLFQFINKEEDGYSLNERGKAACELLPLINRDAEKHGGNGRSEYHDERYYSLFFVMMIITAGLVFVAIAYPGVITLSLLLISSALSAFFLHTSGREVAERINFASALVVTAFIDSAALGLQISVTSSSMKFEPLIIIPVLVPAVVYSAYILPYMMRGGRSIIVGFFPFLVISIFMILLLELQRMFVPSSLTGTMEVGYTPFPIVFYILTVVSVFLLSPKKFDAHGSGTGIQ